MTVLRSRPRDRTRSANHARDRLRHRDHRPRPAAGDRLVEIGCVELVNHIPTGRSFHALHQPGAADAARGASRVHGLDRRVPRRQAALRRGRRRVRRLHRRRAAGRPQRRASTSASSMPSSARLGQRPIADAPHGRHADARAAASIRRARTRSTRSAPATAIDTSRRTLHGALLDAELLAEVYIELIGGRQASLILGEEPEAPTLARRRHVDPHRRAAGAAALPRQRRRDRGAPRRLGDPRRQGDLARLFRCGRGRPRRAVAPDPSSRAAGSTTLAV